VANGIIMLSICSYSPIGLLSQIWFVYDTFGFKCSCWNHKQNGVWCIHKHIKLFLFKNKWTGVILCVFFLNCNSSVNIVLYFHVTWLMQIQPHVKTSNFRWHMQIYVTG
jgi:hypothetical protein